MNNTQKLDISILVMAFFIALLLIATSCSPYGNKCLKPGQLNGAGYTKFNKLSVSNILFINHIF